MKENIKKYRNLIIGIIIALIITVVIIWYRNDKKKKEAELAKAKLISSKEIIPASSTSDIGKTAFARIYGVKVYTTSNFDVAYTKNINDFIGTIQATQTDAGSDSFYKVANTSGQSFYVLKSQVTVK